jgi:hypothetical protein
MAATGVKGPCLVGDTRDAATAEVGGAVVDGSGGGTVEDYGKTFIAPDDL